MQPVVSILIPAHNAERWLAATLESAVNQTWRRKEIIVVDDGSTDATIRVAKEFESRGVTVIAKVHTGQTGTLNRAVAESQGEYVQYLDADDLIHPDKIDRQMTRLTSEPPDAVATCSWARFYADDIGTATFRQQPDFKDYVRPVEWLIQAWGGRGTMPPVAWLIPRTVIERAGPWNESLSLNNDTEYFTRVALSSSKIAFCADAYGYYRSGNVSLSGQRSRIALESFYKVCEICTWHLLAFERSDRTRRACANLWQHFAHWVYPEALDLVHRAEVNAQSFGGASLRLRGSVAFQLARGLVGWKAARRLQLSRRRLRGNRSPSTSH